MFPRPEPQTNVSNDPYTAGSPMSRSFIDSRDRPYSHNVQRPPAIASSHSSPNALPPRSNTVQGLYPPGSSTTSGPAHPSVANLVVDEHVLTSLARQLDCTPEYALLQVGFCFAFANYWNPLLGNIYFLPCSSACSNQAQDFRIIFDNCWRNGTYPPH